MKKSKWVTTKDRQTSYSDMTVNLKWKKSKKNTINQSNTWFHFHTSHFPVTAADNHTHANSYPLCADTTLFSFCSWLAYPQVFLHSHSYIPAHKRQLWQSQRKLIKKKYATSLLYVLRSLFSSPFPHFLLIAEKFFLGGKFKKFYKLNCFLLYRCAFINMFQHAPSSWGNCYISDSSGSSLNA